MKLKKELYCDVSGLPIKNHNEAIIEWFTISADDEYYDIHLVLKDYSHGVKNDVRCIGDLKLCWLEPKDLYEHLLELEKIKPLNPQSFERIIEKLFT